VPIESWFQLVLYKFLINHETNWNRIAKIVGGRSGQDMLVEGPIRYGFEINIYLVNDSEWFISTEIPGNAVNEREIDLDEACGCCHTYKE
jgi:hypothetical protein